MVFALSRTDIALDDPWVGRTHWLPDQPSYLVFHHSVTPVPTSGASAQYWWRRIQDIHRDAYNRYVAGDRTSSPFSDIAYNEGLYPGLTLEGRGLDYQSGATSGTANRTHYAICLLGNYEDVSPSQGLIDTMIERGRELRRIFAGRGRSIKGVDYHQEFYSTRCPGRFVIDKMKFIEAAIMAPEVPIMRGSFDSVRSDEPGKVTVGGWAETNTVTVWVDGDEKYTIPADKARQDVRQVHPDLRVNTGFAEILAVPGGDHTIEIKAGQTSIGKRGVRIAPTSLESLVSEATGALHAARHRINLALEAVDRIQ